MNDIFTGDPYRRVTCNGKPLDAATTAAVRVAEAELGYKLTIIQGIGGAAASAGSHTEGRAVDLVAWDEERKLRVLKDIGFKIWERDELPGVWGPHLHGVLALNSLTNSKSIAPVAFRQIAAFENGRDGLAGNGPDNSYRPKPGGRVFEYPVKKAAQPVTRTPVQEARDEMVQALHNLGQANAFLRKLEDRPVAQAQIQENIRRRRDIRKALDGMPKR